MSTIKEIKKIEREQVALNLKFKGYDAHGNLIEFNELDVRFKDIRNSCVGDEFYPQTANLQNYYFEYAEVIGKTDETAIIRICSEDNFEDEYSESFDMVHVVFD